MHHAHAAGLAFAASAWPLDDSRNTLLFIHGAGSSGAFWAEQMRGLAARYNLLAVDLPGRGGSPGPGKERIADYAQALNALVRELAAPRMVAVGFSMGGAIVQQMLLDRPQSLGAAVLIATGAKLRVHPQILELIGSDYPAYLSQIAATAASPQTPPAQIQAAIDDRAQCDPKVCLGDFLACDRFDLREQITAIDVPVLIINASDDLLTPPAFADFLAQQIPHSQRVQLRDAGHFVAVEKPAAVNQAIEEFLRELN